MRRIDDGDGEARSRQSRSDNGFDPACGLQGDGDRVEGGEFGAEAVQAFRVEFSRKSFPRGQNRHIELILGTLNSDKHRLRTRFHPGPSLSKRARRAALATVRA